VVVVVVVVVVVTGRNHATGNAHAWTATHSSADVRTARTRRSRPSTARACW
jgi:hypothetical protein